MLCLCKCASDLLYCMLNMFATTVYVQLKYIRVDNDTTILFDVLTCSLFERYNNMIECIVISHIEVYDDIL